MNALAQNALILIGSFLDVVHLVNLLSTSKSFWKLRLNSPILERLQEFQSVICNKNFGEAIVNSIHQRHADDAMFLANRILIYHNRYINESKEKPQNLNTKELFKQTWNSSLYASVEVQNMKLIQLFIDKGADNWDYAMYCAAKVGNLDLIQFFINRGASMSSGIEGAAKGGHIDLVEFFLQKGDHNDYEAISACVPPANRPFISKHKELMEPFGKLDEEAWTIALEKGIKNGHIEQDFVEYVLSKTKKHHPGALEGAIRECGQKGYYELFIRLVALVPKKNEKFWNEQLYYTNSKEIAEYCIEQGANNWELSICNCVSSGNLELIKLYTVKSSPKKKGTKKTTKKKKTKSSSEDSIDWDKILRNAVSENPIRKDIIEFIIKQGATDWNGGMEHAARNGHKEWVEYFFKKGANCWNPALCEAAEGQHIEIVKFFIAKGANDFNNALFNAIRERKIPMYDNYWGGEGATWRWGGRMDLVELLVEKGANQFCEAFRLASVTKQTDLMEYFLEKGAEMLKKELKKRRFDSDTEDYIRKRLKL